ncbi:MAG: hypothetical protein F9K23_12265 [Bacteroidetes bacterium]|nr:MAG: hypothetical protein F9K23_12265 [Bacteroidota bacterium]
MAQLIINTKETDLVAQKNRAAALQRLADSPFSNSFLSLLAEWSDIKGAEEKIVQNKGAIKAKLIL